MVLGTASAAGFTGTWISMPEAATLNVTFGLLRTMPRHLTTPPFRRSLMFVIVISAAWTSAAR